MRNFTLPTGTSISGWDGQNIVSNPSVLKFDGNNDNVIKNPINNFPSSEITVEFWMKSSDTSKLGTPISYAISGQDNEFIVYNYNNFRIFTNGNSILTNISATDGNWNHIAATWRNSDGQTKLYKNGSLAFTGTLTGGALGNGGALVLGQEQDSVGGSFDSTQAFKGSIPYIQIYNMALNGTEILQHYNNTKGRFGF